jgi:hypothetical protein
MHLGTIRWARPRPRRIVWACAAGAARVAAGAVFMQGGVSWWVVLVALIGPDLAVLAGITSFDGLERGQMPHRVVRPYNALHRLWGPAVLAAFGLAVLPSTYLVAAIAWAFHIFFDRALGYGLRTPDGWRA